MRSAGTIIVLALVAGGAFLGYLRGGADCRSAYQAREMERIQKSKELDDARREAERERDALSRRLEEEAHADPVDVPQCFGPERVLRLNNLR